MRVIAGIPTENTSEKISLVKQEENSITYYRKHTFIMDQLNDRSFFFGNVVSKCVQI